MREQIPMNTFDLEALREEIARAIDYATAIDIHLRLGDRAGAYWDCSRFIESANCISRAFQPIKRAMKAAPARLEAAE